MSDSERELALRIGAKVAAVSEHYFPAVSEALQRVGDRERVSYTLRVTVWKEHGLIAGRVTSSAPKIPTPRADPSDFVLELQKSGQLSFFTDGAVHDLLKTATPEPEDDGYVPGDNAGNQGVDDE